MEGNFLKVKKKKVDYYALQMLQMLINQITYVFR